MLHEKFHLLVSVAEKAGFDLLFCEPEHVILVFMALLNMEGTGNPEP